MTKEIITFSAIQQTLIKTGGIDCFAGETVEYVEAQFDLGENWSGYDHIDAIWTNDGNFAQIAKTLSPGGACQVPPEVLKSIGDVKVNLVGATSSENEITERFTTYPIFALGVNANVPVSGSETQPITPSQFDQFVAIVIAEVEKVTGMTAEAVTLPAGSAATAEYTNGKLILGIPQGIQGEKGDTGETGNGIDHVLFNSDYSLSIVFTNGEIFRTPPIRGERGPQGPQGVPGDTGETGATPDIQIGSVETLPAGSPAEVTITGTPEDPVLNFKLPEGAKGDTGETPDIQIGTVETLPAGSPAEVTITGTPEDPELNFKIPKGDTGEVTLEDLSSLLPLDTASGDIISIPDGQPVIPVQSLKVQLDPIQDLHGYDKPWSGGAGKNKFDASFMLATGISVTGNTVVGKGEDFHNAFATNGIPNLTFKANTQYTFSLKAFTDAIASQSGNGLLFRFTYTDNTSKPLWLQNTSTTATPYQATSDAGKTISKITMSYGGTSGGNTWTLTDLQIEEGSTATAWSPYINICPIEGWTDVDTHITGKNLLDKDNITWTNGLRDDSGNIVSSGSHFTNEIYGIKPNTQYTISGTLKTTGNYRIYFLKKDGTWISRTAQLITSPYTFTTPTDCGAVQVQVSANITNLDDVQLELGSVASDFEPYEGSVIHTAIEGHYTPVGTNNVPYILRDTPDVDGDRLREKIVGGTVAWNQKYDPAAINSNTTSGVTFVVNSDGTILVNGTASATIRKNVTTVSIGLHQDVGHRLLLLGCPSGGSSSGYKMAVSYIGESTIDIGNGAIWSVPDTQYSGFFSIIISEGTACNNLVFAPQLIDLTQMFGSTIADYIYSLEQSEAGAGVAFFKSLFLDDYYPYDSGELMSVKTSAHVMTDADENAVTYPLDNIELRGIPKLADGSLYYDGDEYEADGSVTRKYGIVDLGTLTWTLNTAYGEHCFSAVVNGKMGGAVNSVCSKYVTEAVAIANLSNKAYRGHGSNSTIYVRDDSYSDADTFKAEMNGVMFVYELATPTSESATPFEEIQKVFAGGTEAYTDERTVPIPVGHETEHLSRVVYGCTIDIVTGECVIDRAMVTLDGVTSGKSFYGVWGATNNGYAVYWNDDIPRDYSAISDKFVAHRYGYDSMPLGSFVGGSGVNTTWTFILPSSVTSLAEANAWLAENPTTIAYHLATPQTINLTPEEIKLLLGDNTIWSDGHVTMIYNADVTRWIEKKLGS